MRYVVEVKKNAPGDRVYLYRGTGYYTDVKKLNPQPLPSYVSELAVQNSELSEQITQYKDFVTSVCHALGVSLSLTQGEIVNEIHRLKRRFGEVEKELGHAAERLEQKERLLQAAIKDSDYYRGHAKEHEAAAIDMGNDLLAVREKLKEVEIEANDLHAENRTLKDQEASLHLQLLGARSGRESWHREYDKAIKDIEVLQAENTKLKALVDELKTGRKLARLDRDVWRCMREKVDKELDALKAANAALVKERNDALEMIEKCQH